MEDKADKDDLFPSICQFLRSRKTTSACLSESEFCEYPPYRYLVEGAGTNLYQEGDDIADDEYLRYFLRVHDRMLYANT